MEENGLWIWHSFTVIFSFSLSVVLLTGVFPMHSHWFIIDCESCIGPDSEITAVSEQGPLWLNLMKPPSAAGCAYILCVSWEALGLQIIPPTLHWGELLRHCQNWSIKMCHLGLAGPDLLMDIFSCNLLLELFFMALRGRRLRTAKNWSSAAFRLSRLSIYCNSLPFNKRRLPLLLLPVASGSLRWLPTKSWE